MIQSAAPLDSPPPAGESPELLLLSGGSDVLRAPEVVGDVGVGQHRDDQRDEELDEEHDEGDDGTGGAGQDELTPVESPAGGDGRD